MDKYGEPTAYQKAAAEQGYLVHWGSEHLTCGYFKEGTRPGGPYGTAQEAWKAACIDNRISILPHLDEFTTKYLKAALWSTTDEDSGDGSNLLASYAVSDFAPAALADAHETCEDFQEATAADLAAAYAIPAHGGYTPAMAGFDFWLSRNGHGAGFYDRGMKALGDKLHAAAKVYSGIDLYVADDGSLHFTAE